MSMRYFSLFLTVLCLLSCVVLSAQESYRPATMSVTLHAGPGQVRNTYLAPLLYSGINYGVETERWRMYKPHGERCGDRPQWINWQSADLNFTMADDKSEMSSTWAGRLRYRYGALYAWQHHHDDGWVMAAGPYIGAEAGFDYNLKIASSNNPATARAAANLGATALVSYSFSRCPGTVGSKPLRLQLQVSAPLLGAALMPDFGASYYESFYLDSPMHSINFTSPHNQQDLDVKLSADVPWAIIPWLRRYDHVLRVGANYHIETMDIHHVVNRHSRFEFVLGWVYQYLPYGRSKTNLLRGNSYEVF